MDRAKDDNVQYYVHPDVKTLLPITWRIRNSYAEHNRSILGSKYILHKHSHVAGSRDTGILMCGDTIIGLFRLGSLQPVRYLVRQKISMLTSTNTTPYFNIIDGRIHNSTIPVVYPRARPNCGWAIITLRHDLPLQIVWDQRWVVCSWNRSRRSHCLEINSGTVCRSLNLWNESAKTQNHRWGQTNQIGIHKKT